MLQQSGAEKNLPAPTLTEERLLAESSELGRSSSNIVKPVPVKSPEPWYYDSCWWDLPLDQLLLRPPPSLYRIRCQVKRSYRNGLLPVWKLSLECPLERYPRCFSYSNTKLALQASRGLLDSKWSLSFVFSEKPRLCATVRTSVPGTIYRLFLEGPSIPSHLQLYQQPLAIYETEAYSQVKFHRIPRLSVLLFRDNGEDLGPREFFALSTRRPRWNNELGRFELPFSGRAHVSSVKNFQVVLPSDPTKVVMQFGKRDKKTFVLDYEYPFSALTALGAALSYIGASGV